MMNYKVFLALAISSLAFTSCNKKVEPKKPDPRKQIIKEKGQIINNLEVKSIEIDATDYHKWIYFSFKEGKVVNVTDPQNDMSWDIAFKRSDVKTNGGTSGKGHAMGMETAFRTFKEMDISYMTSLAKDFKVDTIFEIQTDPNHDGRIVTVSQSLNPELNRGITVIPKQTTAPDIRISNKVFFFRDAEGKYGAIKFTDYFKALSLTDVPAGGYVHIEYQYPIDPTEK